jgi:predicted TPR repeat methyltransferase
MLAAYGALRRGGLLTFTAEALLEEGTEPYRLTASGRYAHRDTYVRGVLGNAGFQILDMEIEWLRWECGKKVMFHSVSAQKPHL